MATIFLKDVRIAFCDLYEPRGFEDGGKKRYGATLLVEPDSPNDKLIRQTIQEAAIEKFGDKDKAAKFVKSVAGQKGQFCYLDGDVKDYDGFAGNMALAAHRNDDQGAPAVVDRDKTPLPQSSGKVYAGCYVNAKVDIWIQHPKYPGVRCTLAAVQFNRDGEAFAGSRANAEGFDDLGSDEEAEDGEGSQYF